MMGRKDKLQSPLFYSFNLDEVVPQDHLLRKTDHFLDLSGLHQHLASYYSHTGRPSVDPELMIRMLMIGITHFTTEFFNTIGRKPQVVTSRDDVPGFATNPL